MLSLLLTLCTASAAPGDEEAADEVLTEEILSTERISAPATEPDATEPDATELLRQAVRDDDLEALEAALAAGADPWDSASGPTPVWMALDRPRPFLEAMLREVPEERHAAMFRVWSRLDPEDPRRSVLDPHVPEALRAMNPDQLRGWLGGFSTDQQEALIRIIGLELLPSAVAFSPEALLAAQQWFGDAWLPRVVWLGAHEYDYAALADAPPLDDAHQQALRAAWRELGLLQLMEANELRTDIQHNGAIGSLTCGVTGHYTEDQVRGAFGRPYSGAIRRRSGHLYWPEVEVYLHRSGADWRVERIYMTGDPQGCWSKGARLIGVPAPFARWVLGPEPWTTESGATVSLYAGEDGAVRALELVWPSEDAS